MSAGFGQMTSLMEGTAGAAKSSPAGLMLSLVSDADRLTVLSSALYTVTGCVDELRLSE